MTREESPAKHQSSSAPPKCSRSPRNKAGSFRTASASAPAPAALAVLAIVALDDPHSQIFKVSHRSTLPASPEFISTYFSTLHSHPQHTRCIPHRSNNIQLYPYSFNYTHSKLSGRESFRKPHHQ